MEPFLLFLYIIAPIILVICIGFLVINMTMDAKQKQKHSHSQSPSLSPSPDISSPIVYLLTYESNSTNTWNFKSTSTAHQLRSDHAANRVNTLMINGQLFHIDSISSKSMSSTVNVTLILSPLCSSTISFIECNNANTSPNSNDNKALIVLGYYV